MLPDAIHRFIRLSLNLLGAFHPRGPLEEAAFKTAEFYYRPPKRSFLNLQEKTVRYLARDHLTIINEIALSSCAPQKMTYFGKAKNLIEKFIGHHLEIRPAIKPGAAEN